MSDQEIIAALVKGRERCRQLVQFYQGLHAATDPDGSPTRPDTQALQTANRILSQALDHLHSLPAKPSHAVADAEARHDAERLLREIGDLVQTALVAERELRERAASHAPPAGPARRAALQMYAAR